MQKRMIVLIVCFFSFNLITGQENIRIQTDSSSIEIIKNSAYHVFIETYKNKDSVFYSAKYTQDTTIIYKQGWKKKSEDMHKLGVWESYSIDGNWLYNINYDEYSWEYNKSEYPYMALLDSVKKMADSIIIKKYGLDFFMNNVKFKFDGYSYKSGTSGQDWVSPMKEKPDNFTLIYVIQLEDGNQYFKLLDLSINLKGELLNSRFMGGLLFQERKKNIAGKLNITSEKAIAVCKEYGLKANEAESIATSLHLGDVKKGQRDKYFYVGKDEKGHFGKYYFEVSQKYFNKTEGDCSSDCIMTACYDVWKIDPWTLKLLSKQRVTSITMQKNGYLYHAKKVKKMLKKKLTDANKAPNVNAAAE